MEQISSRHHREQDEDDGEGKNRSKVCSEISPGREDRRGIEQRRKKKIKDQLRIEVNRGKPRDQSEDHPSDGQKDWIGDPDFPGSDRQQGDGHKTNQN